MENPNQSANYIGVNQMRRFAIVLATVLLAACGGDSTGPSTPNVVGSWSLHTVNGLALPAVLAQTTTTKTEVTSGTLNLNADGTFSDIANYRLTSGVTVTTTQGASTGTWSQANSAVQLTYLTNGSGTANAAISGRSLTFLDQGQSVVFTR